MICEMCGQEVDTVTPVNVEGSVLRTCGACAKFGRPVGSPAAAPGPRQGPDREALHERLGQARGRGLERDLFAELPDRELDPEWSRTIRQTRERLGLTQEQFGQRINEKTSVVHKLESGAFTPPDALVRKIERTFKVRLTARPGNAG
jgi:putative transcription factor